MVAEMFFHRKKETENAPNEQKQVTFRRLIYESVPEMWSFQFIAMIVLSVLTGGLGRLARFVVGTRAEALTSANAKEVLLSGQGLVVLLIGTAVALLCIAIDLFAMVYLSDAILNGKRGGTFRMIQKGVLSLRRFLNPSGLSILLYIFIAVPLGGLGFSISLTRGLYIPHFIMDWIAEKPLFYALYIAAIAAMLFVGFVHIFAVHAVLLKGMTPREAKRYSTRLIQKNGKAFAWGMVKAIVFVFLIRLLANILLQGVPESVLEVAGESLPRNYDLDLMAMRDDLMSGEAVLSDLDVTMILYRFASAFAVLEGSFLDWVCKLVLTVYLMVRFTLFFQMYDKDTDSGTVYLERPKKGRYFVRIACMIGIGVFVAGVAFVIGLFYHGFFYQEEPMRIVAHRCGGYMESENSLEGLEAAIARHCYASETDVQRTKDGHYIINHDDTFKRLTGVNKAPQDLTMDEIEKLRIKDTTGSGKELPVVTIEEMLDVIKDREKLFIELKGKTADRQMVDDIVRIVREKDCVDDVALISLKYDVVDYAETTYPEFETGLLFFAGYGNLADLHCDILIMEEELATTSRIGNVHNAGKQAMVWTVNTQNSLYNFLDSNADGIITDEIILAEQVQKELDERSEVQVMEDALDDFWEDH